MHYNEVKEAKTIYKRKLRKLLDEIKEEIEIIGVVETNCKDNIVIRSYKEIPKGKLAGLKSKGLHGYKRCNSVREDYPYNYVLYNEKFNL